MDYTLWQMPGKFVAVDTETTGLNPWRGDKVFAIGFAWPNGDRWDYWTDYKHITDTDPSLVRFRRVLEDPTIDKVFTNVKFDVRMLEMTYGWKVRGRCWDTSIFCHLLDGRDAEGGLSLDAQAKKYVPLEVPKLITELEDWCRGNGFDHLLKGKKYGAYFKDMPRDLMVRRVVGDANLTLKIFQRVGVTVGKTFPRLLSQEHNLWPVVRKAEDRGLCVDYEEIDAQGQYLQSVVDDVVEFAQSLIGCSFWNINSPNDQKDLLIAAGIYDRITEVTKPAKNRKSKKPFVPKRKMNAENLFLLHHPAAAMLLVGKMAQKMISPFLRQAYELSVDGVLHPGYKQTGTTSGRFSCVEPNLQNIPTEGDKKGNLTEDEQQELTDLTGYRLGVHIKRIFKVREGFAHIHADLKQAEMVALAHYTQDASLIDIFERGESIHDGMCALLYPEEPEITKGLKQRSKQVTFGYMYGMRANTLSKRLRSTVGEATRMQTRLGKTFPGLPRWYADLCAQLRSQGYVETDHGRRHYLRSNDQYMSVNRMCQGTVGDEVKASMIALDNMFESEGVGSLGGCTVLLNIHDDIASEVPKDMVPIMGPKIHEVMENTSIAYRAPMRSSLDVTYTRWSDLKEIEDPRNAESYV